jgi:excisionase family DNA binding protein
MSTLPESGAATISVPEAARILGISRRSAYRYANSGDLPAIRIRGRLVIPRHRLLEMLNGTSVATPENVQSFFGAIDGVRGSK